MYYITGWLIWPQDTEPRQRWRLRDWDQLKLRLRECWKLVSVLTGLRSRDWKKQWVIDYIYSLYKQFSHSCAACRILCLWRIQCKVLADFFVWTLGCHTEGSACHRDEEETAVHLTKRPHWGWNPRHPRCLG